MHPLHARGLAEAGSTVVAKEPRSGEEGRPPCEGRGAALDSAAIFACVGAVPYEWRLESDHIVWGPNAGSVLKGLDVPAAGSGRGWAQLVDPTSGPGRSDTVLSSGQRDGGEGVRYELQYALRLGPDRLLWVEDTGRWFAGGDGRPARALGVVRVIDERHAREERLAYLSRFDPLTGEMNRMHLTEVLQTSIEEAMKLRSSCGFLLVAIDNLSRINEAYGFDVGDQVIAEVAKRIRRQLRGKDDIGRFAGNTFGVLLRSCTPDDMLVAADRLLAAVRDEVVQTAAGPVAVTITIGGVTAPRHARSLRDLLCRAQDALEGAKARRRGAFLAYQPSLERDAQRRQNVRATEEIVAALNARRIFLVYEPVVSVRSRQPAFYECLMRVRRADGRLLMLNEVVPLAERLGLVRLLDHRVLELVLAELVAAPELRASLNVSAASTMDQDWWEVLVAMLRAHPGVAHRLIVEITETAAIHDLDDARGFVARVKELGCRIAIDDFGAGHTSFRNLRKLGVDLVKIDGAFVQNIGRSDDDRIFVQALIDLARRLGLQTVAEWVQDESAAAMLAGWGCDYLQGALIGLASEARPWRKGQAIVA
jgi:diguanylate cyclase (GGDEF)-like protein